jgi:trimethylamine--corrinoid protein Co-methyltransferase
MPADARPSLRLLSDDTIARVIEDARRILEEIGVLVEHSDAVELLDGAGATLGSDHRVRIPADLVETSLSTVSSRFALYDREGESPVTIGGGSVCYDPGSAAILVFDHETQEARPAVVKDCVTFARLTEQLPAMALQSTCVVPSDVPREKADLTRLGVVLQHCRKPVITGTFAAGSFAVMHRMLLCVRGDAAALRHKPLAIFDCCPSAPLNWSELTCSVLVQCARAGVPAELISMPMTGATAPVTLLDAITQHAAENLSGVVIHQLAGPGAPLVWGGSGSAFDMRYGTSPMASIESMMLNAACAEVGRFLGLPRHAYLALSDTKVVDYQAGWESGQGALLAALTGLDVVSGAGMLDLESCQSLEKLVLDHEACRAALRAIEGISRRGDTGAVELLREGVQNGQFLNLGHTRRWFREEFLRPGPVVDRQDREGWRGAGGRTASERAHEEVQRLLALETAPSLDPAIVRELETLMRG